MREETRSGWVPSDRVADPPLDALLRSGAAPQSYLSEKYAGQFAEIPDRRLQWDK